MFSMNQILWYMVFCVNKVNQHVLGYSAHGLYSTCYSVSLRISNILCNCKELCWLWPSPLQQEVRNARLFSLNHRLAHCIWMWFRQLWVRLPNDIEKGVVCTHITWFLLWTITAFHDWGAASPESIAFQWSTNLFRLHDGDAVWMHIVPSCQHHGMG